MTLPGIEPAISGHKADALRTDPLCQLKSITGWNIFGTMEICSRYEQLEPLRVNHDARSG